jgi:hypothetical protein
MNTKNIWGTIAVLSVFLPTVSLANPPEPIAPAASPAPANLVQPAPEINVAVKTAENIARVDIQADLAKLASTCNISDPMTCISGAQGMLGSIGGIGIPGLGDLTTNINGMISRGLNDLAQQFPFLAGLFGQSNVAAVPTSQEIAKANVDEVQKVAATSLALQARANAEVLQQAQAKGVYQTGVAGEMINRKSKAFAASMTGTAALQANKQNSDAAVADVKTANSVAATDFDSSLDAISGTNKLLAAVARGQERINAALIESKTTQGQLLDQTALVRDTINESNIRHDAAIQSHIDTQASQQCFTASIYMPKLTCK